jgi:two-component system, NarL family, response regulator
MTQRGLDSLKAEASKASLAVPRERAPNPASRSHSGHQREDIGTVDPHIPAQKRDPQALPLDQATIRILVADDHPILREGLVALINRQSGMKVVAEAADGCEAVALFSRVVPDIAVLDLRMPAMNGIETLTAIRTADPQARLIILTSFASDEDIYRALRAGARGYLVKDAPAEELVQCLRTVYEGGTFIPPAIASKLAERVGTAELTAREREVLALIAKGKGNREIGAALVVTEGTIKVHVNNILNKLGVASRTEAVNIAVRRGLVRIDD